MNEPGERAGNETPLILTQPRCEPTDASERRFLAIAGCFLAFDCLIFASRFNAIVFAASCIAILSQCSLLAIWTAMGAGYWPMRQLQAFGLAASGYACARVGAGLMDPGASFGSGDLARDAGFLSLLFFGWQIPLWVCRLLFGWRIDRPSAVRPSPVAETRQFGILDLLFITALVAALLGTLRLGFSLDAAAARELSVAFLGAAAFSALTTLPCLWFALGMQNQDAGCLAMVWYAPALGVLVLIGGAATLATQDSWLPILLLALSICLFITTGITHAALSGFRDDGYRLVRLQR
jgi:hypothetical protein